MLDGKTVGVLVGRNIDGCAVQIAEILRAMKNVNARVRIVSSSNKHCRQKRHGTISADLAIDEARPKDFDAIIVCCDCICAPFAPPSSCVKFLEGAYFEGKIIAAIDRGLKLIDSANLVNKDGVSYLASMDEGIRKANGCRANRAIIREANLILARDPIMLMNFINAIIEALRKPEK
jgi:putative intracellular protease/amidase